MAPGEPVTVSSIQKKRWSRQVPLPAGVSLHVPSRHRTRLSCGFNAQELGFLRVLDSLFFLQRRTVHSSFAQSQREDNEVMQISNGLVTLLCRGLPRGIVRKRKSLLILGLSFQQRSDQDYHSGPTLSFLYLYRQRVCACLWSIFGGIFSIVLEIIKMWYSITGPRYNFRWSRIFFSDWICLLHDSAGLQ